MADRNEDVRVECVVMHKTIRAVLLEQEGTEVWCPLALISAFDGDFVWMPRWKAEELGLECI